MTCEKCWNDSYLTAMGTGKSHADAYFELVLKRENKPCTEEEQAGMFWDPEEGIDKRKTT